MVHEFHGACDDTVAMARLGMRRTLTACSLTLPSGRSATRRFLLPASVTRRCRVRPKLVHFGWGVLLLHAGQRHFRAPTCTRCRRTSMQTGVANRLALLPLLR
jgi:hypothetical protein